MSLLQIFAAGYLLAMFLAWMWIRGATKDQEPGPDDDEQWDW